MINLTPLPSHSLSVGRGVLVPQRVPLLGNLASAEAGQGAHLGCVCVDVCGRVCGRVWTRVCPDVWTRVCPCMESRARKGLEVSFLGCILCGHTVMLLPVNEHMAAGRREGRPRDGGDLASWSLH